MPRFCYCSEILPEKAAVIRAHWKKKKDDDPAFWQSMKMNGFECFLQDNLFIYCVEGEDLSYIFKGLRDNNVFGKGYALVETEPKSECLLDITLEKPSSFIKRAFAFPLLPNKEEAHRKFRKEAMGSKKERHEASLRAFGVFKMTTWLQHTKDKKYIVVYTERHINTPQTSCERLSQGKNCSEWKEISAELMDHTGLKLEELSPEVEWLTL